MTGVVSTSSSRRRSTPSQGGGGGGAGSNNSKRTIQQQQQQGRVSARAGLRAVWELVWLSVVFVTLQLARVGLLALRWMLGVVARVLPVLPLPYACASRCSRAMASLAGIVKPTTTAKSTAGAGAASGAGSSADSTALLADDSIEFSWATQTPRPDDPVATHRQLRVTHVLGMPAEVLGYGAGGHSTDYHLPMASPRLAANVPVVTATATAAAAAGAGAGAGVGATMDAPLSSPSWVHKDVIVVVLPGNPGAPQFYDEFMSAL